MSSQNLASKVNVKEREGVRLRDRVKEENEPDMYDPNSEKNPNAPKQSTPGAEKGETESATERLVKNIKNASKDADSKETTSFTPRHIEFTKNLDELRKIGERMASITGDSNEFNLDDIFNRLEAL